MSFGNPRGGRTPAALGALGGIFNFLAAARDRKRQDTLDALRQAIEQHQLQQQDQEAALRQDEFGFRKQQYGDQQTQQALENARQARRETDADRAPVLGVLQRVLAGGPEHPEGVAAAFQSYGDTGTFPSAPQTVRTPIMAPGIPGGVPPQPAQVNLPQGLAGVLASAGLGQQEREFNQRMQETRDAAASKERIAALQDQGKRLAAGEKDRSGYLSRMAAAFIKGGGQYQDYPGFIASMSDEWDRQHGAATTGAPAAPGPNGVGYVSPDPEANPRGVPVAAPAPAGSSAGAGLTGGLPSAVADVARKNAQTGLATARTGDVAANAADRAARAAAATTNATTNAKRETSQEIAARLNREQQARLATQRDATTRRGQDLAHGDRNTVQLETARHNQQMEAVRRAMTASQGTASNTPEMQVWRARVQQQRSEVSQAWSLYSKEAAQQGKSDDKPGSRLHSLGADLATKRATLNDTLKNSPSGAVTPKQGNRAAIQQDIDQMGTQPAQSLSQKRQQAAQVFQNKYGLSTGEARQRAVKLFPGP